MTDHSDIDHTGLTGVGGSSTGLPVFVLPTGSRADGTGTSGTAGTAYAFPVILPASIRLRSLWIEVQTSAAGSLQWGLFDYSSNAAACTKKAGGSAASGGTGWREIAATGAPVVVGAGNYMLIIKQPDSTQPTLFRVAANNTLPFAKSQGSYVWDDTPDLTSGWTDTTTIFNCGIEGDLTSSNGRW